MLGTQRFKGVNPGDLFIGLLAPEVEARAVARGSIEVVQSGRVKLDSTRLKTPRGWTDSSRERSP